MTVTTAASGTPNIALWCSNANNNLTYAGTAGNGTLVWGAQLELGSTATAYEPKTTQGSTSEVFRGNKRDFPRLAGIVAEASNLNIYDLTEPGRPMWGRWALATFNTANAVCAAQGRVLVGCANGLVTLDHAGNGGRFQQGGNDRVFSLTERSTQTLIARQPVTYITANTVNSIAAMVMPDAPVDPVTGLAVPTIALGTTGGPSIIRHDGVVTNPYGSSLSSTNINFGSRGEVIFHIGENSTNYRVSLPPYTSFTAYSDSAITPPTTSYPTTNTEKNRVNAKRVAALPTNGSPNGIYLFRDNGAGQRSAAARITNSINSGFMHGAIRRAYLSDVEVGSLGTELLSNGDFSSGSTGWTITNAGTNSVTISGGSARFQTTGSSDNCTLAQTISLTAGRFYKIEFDVLPGSSGFLKVVPFGPVEEITFACTPGRKVITGFAYSTGAFRIARIATAGFGADAYIDNISVKEIPADVSVRASSSFAGRGIPLAGSLTKTAVASAAQLVAYSGFDNLDYLREPYATDLDFGTGDFNVSAWLNTSGFGPHNLLTFPEQFENAVWNKTNSFVQTNLLTWSEDLSNAAWVALNQKNIVASTAVTPAGNQTAWVLSDNSTSVYEGVSRATITVANDSAPYTISIYVLKTSGGTAPTFGINASLTGGTAVNINFRFNTDTGVVTGSNGSAVAVGAWWRVSTTITNNSTGNTNLSFAMYPATSASGGADNPTATGSVTLWGAQLVLGSVPGDYQRTTAAPAAVQYTDPFGNKTAEKIVENTAAAVDHSMRGQSAAVVAGTTYIHSVYLKAGERTKVQFYHIGETVVFIVDLLTGGVTTVSGSPLVSVVDAGNGWFRVRYIQVATSASLQVLYFGLYTTAVGYTGDGTSGIYIYGAQLNRGSVATLYKPGQFLAYDNSGWLVDRSTVFTGSELVTNGDFSSGSTGWTLGTGWSVSGGAATFSAGADNSDLTRPVSAPVTGRTYLVSITQVHASGGQCRVIYGNVGYTLPAASGAFTFLLTAAAGGDSNVRIRGLSASSVFTVDNISVKEYWEPHIRLGLDSQARLIASVSDGITTRTAVSTSSYNTSTWTKAELAYRAGRLALSANGVEVAVTHGTPLLSLSSRYNLVNWSEQIDNAAWIKGTATVVANSAAAPDGYATADLCIQQPRV